MTWKQQDWFRELLCYVRFAFGRHPHVSVIVWKRNFFSLFSKKFASTRSDSHRFRPSTHPRVSVFEKLGFRPSPPTRENSVFKKFHSGERFWKLPFSAVVFIGFVRFQMKTDTCAQGLKCFLWTAFSVDLELGTTGSILVVNFCQVPGY